MDFSRSISRLQYGMLVKAVNSNQTILFSTSVLYVDLHTVNLHMSVSLKVPIKHIIKTKLTHCKMKC